MQARAAQTVRHRIQYPESKSRRRNNPQIKREKAASHHEIHHDNDPATSWHQSSGLNWPSSTWHKISATASLQNAGQILFKTLVIASQIVPIWVSSRKLYCVARMVIQTENDGKTDRKTCLFSPTDGALAYKLSKHQIFLAMSKHCFAGGGLFGSRLFSQAIGLSSSI